jgi:hypothetical protein
MTIAAISLESYEQPSWLGRGSLVDHLVSELAPGRIQSVAFVVPSDVSMPGPLYEVAVATARRGWKIGIDGVHYWFVTPEPKPLPSFGAALEPEGIAFIGSTFPDVRHGVVLLDPQGESIEADVVVSLDQSGGFDLSAR